MDAAHELRGALLALAEQLPASKDSALYLDARLIDRFMRFSERECRNCRAWRRDQKRYLTWWSRALGRVNLRALSVVRHVLPALEDTLSARPQRIAVLKRLFSWLCNVRHVLALDPLTTLKVPQTTPEQWRRSKVVSAETLNATRRRLSRTYRDALDVLLGTAWHCTELERFAHSGELIAPTPVETRARVAGVLGTRHKSGHPFRTAVSARVFNAARRVRERSGISLSNFCKALRRAARAARVEPWAPGCLRHTVATYAMQAGADPAAVSAFLGHQDTRTTRRFYAVYVAPRKVPTPR